MTVKKSVSYYISTLKLNKKERMLVYEAAYALYKQRPGDQHIMRLIFNAAHDEAQQFIRTLDVNADIKKIGLGVKSSLNLVGAVENTKEMAAIFPELMVHKPTNLAILGRWGTNDYTKIFETIINENTDKNG